jgi:hypothetical protein
LLHNTTTVLNSGARKSLSTIPAVLATWDIRSEKCVQDGSTSSFCPEVDKHSLVDVSSEE